jgi:hypothetical protein
MQTARYAQPSYLVATWQPSKKVGFFSENLWVTLFDKKADCVPISPFLLH